MINLHSDNEIGTAGAKLIASALERNETVTSIDLHSEYWLYKKNDIQ